MCRCDFDMLISKKSAKPNLNLKLLLSGFALLMPFLEDILL